MFKALSLFFESIGLPPVLGGFIVGILFCVTIALLKRLLGIGASDAPSDALAKFRDPNAFSSDFSTGASSSSPPVTHQTNTLLKDLPAHTSAQIVDALRKGSKIEAVKLYKDATSLGLKESKEAVEAIQRQLGL